MGIEAEKEQQGQALLAVLRIGIAAMARQEAESHLDWFENREKHAEADKKARESFCGLLGKIETDTLPGTLNRPDDNPDGDSDG